MRHLLGAIGGFTVSLFSLLGCSGGHGGSDDTADTVQVDTLPDTVAWVGGSLAFQELVVTNLELEDDQGKDPSWVEIENIADTAMSLAGIALTDKATDSRWAFGDVSLAPHSRILVFLSGRDVRVPTPSKDSINLMTDQVWSWADGQNDPPGFSTVDPWEYSGLVGADSLGRPIVSAVMTLGDNSSTELTWASATVFMGFRSTDPSDTLDLSGRTSLVVTATIDKNRVIHVVLAQNGLEDWKGWKQMLTGTGSRQTYEISLPQGTDYPDLTQMYGVNFRAVDNQLGPVHFTIHDMYAQVNGIPMHASFTPDKQGGSLYLLDLQGRIMDSLHYPELPAGMAWAKSGGHWGYAESPTPGAVNGVVLESRMSVTEATPGPGFYAAPIRVELPAVSGGEIRYTTDGSEPGPASPLYSAPIRIDSTTTLRYASFASGALRSEVVSRTWFVADSAPLPIVSISTDPMSLFHPDTGLFELGPFASPEEPNFGANFWNERTVPVHVEFLEAGGKFGWQNDAGLQVFGNWSRAWPQKSLALFFKEDYGNNKVEYPLFPQAPQIRKFRSLVLRNGGNNFQKDHVRDPLMTSLTAEMGMDFQKSRGVVVYIDGQYWGLMDLREKANEDWFWSNYGMDASSIDLVKGYDEVQAGSDADYKVLLTALESGDPSDSALWARVDRELDWENYADYVGSEIYFGNTDWPANNTKHWRSSAGPTRWRWYLYDTDFGLGSMEQVDLDMFPFVTASDGPDWPNSPASTLLFRRLLLNPQFQRAFINRLALHLAYEFSPSRVEGKLDSMVAYQQPAWERDADRWDHDRAYFASELQTIRTWIAQRPATVMAQMATFFSLGTPVPVHLGCSGDGIIQVDGAAAPRSLDAVFFSGTPLTLRALPAQGKAFAGWSDGVRDAVRSWDPALGSVTAQFR